jgi:hypothetical protein
MGEAAVRKPSRAGRIAVWGCAVAVGALATSQVHRFQFSSHFDLFPGPKGDTRLTAYIVEHWYQAILGHEHVASPAMFYPVKGTLGYSDAHLIYVPIYALLRWLGVSPLLALELVVIAFTFLNFVAGVVLLTAVFRTGVLAAAAGALFFAFNNPKLAQPDHLQLHPVFLLPAVVGPLVVFFRDARSLSGRRAFGLLAVAGVALDLQLLSSFYLGWFLAFWAVLFTALVMVTPPSRAFVVTAIRSQSRAVAGAVVVCLAGMVPFALVYLPAVRATGWYGLLPDYIPELKSFLLMADGNYVWGRMTAALLDAASGPDWGRRIGVGLVPTIAWLGASAVAVWFLLAMWAGRPGSERVGDPEPSKIAHLFLALMIVATDAVCLLALQLHGHTLWKFVYLTVPGARAIRAVARYPIALALPMAIAFAVGLQSGMRKIAARAPAVRALLGGAILVVVVFGVAEQFNSGEGQYYSIGAEAARIERLAARLAPDCTAFYVAAPARGGTKEGFEEQNYMHDAMLVSLARHIPTLNGRSGKNPRGWNLRDVAAPDYEENVDRWIRARGIRGRVCRLEIEAP